MADMQWQQQVLGVSWITWSPNQHQILNGAEWSLKLVEELLLGLLQIILTQRFIIQFHLVWIFYEMNSFIGSWFILFLLLAGSYANRQRSCDGKPCGCGGTDACLFPFRYRVFVVLVTLTCYTVFIVWYSSGCYCGWWSKLLLWQHMGKCNRFRA